MRLIFLCDSGTLSQVGNEFGRSGGTLTNSTVANWLVSKRKLGKVVANHVGLDLDWVPVLATVHVHNGIAHFWHNDAVSQVGLHGLWLLAGWNILLGLSQFFDKSIILSLDSVSESSLLSGVEQINNFVIAHLQEFIELVASENLLLEWFLLWGLSGSGI